MNKRLTAVTAARARARNPPRRRAASGLLLAAGTALLAACSGTLLPKPGQPPARFTLDDAAPTTAAAATAAAPASAEGAPNLTVDVPRAAPGYDSRRMVYLRRPQALEAFAFHEWVAPPARMLTPLLVRALQDSGAFGVVLSSPTAATAHWRLETELLRLQHDFIRQPSRVWLTVRAVLLDGTTQQALAWREFDVGVDAAGDDPVSGALAAQAAARQLAVAVAAFCAAQVQDTAPPAR